MNLTPILLIDTFLYDIYSQGITQSTKLDYNTEEIIKYIRRRYEATDYNQMISNVEKQQWETPLREVKNDVDRHFKTEKSEAEKMA